MRTVRAVVKSSATLVGNGPMKTLELRTRGLSITFDPAFKVSQIAFYAPYAGAIKGIKLGDTGEKVVSIMGPPKVIPKLVKHLSFREYTYAYPVSANNERIMFRMTFGYEETADPMQMPITDIFLKGTFAP
jgi:hypothetical protein